MKKLMKGLMDSWQRDLDGKPCDECKKPVPLEKQFSPSGANVLCPDCVGYCARCGDPVPPKYADDCGYCP